MFQLYKNRLIYTKICSKFWCFKKLPHVAKVFVYIINVLNYNNSVLTLYFSNNKVKRFIVKEIQFYYACILSLNIHNYLVWFSFHKVQYIWSQKIFICGLKVQSIFFYINGKGVSFKNSSFLHLPPISSFNQSQILPSCSKAHTLVYPTTAVSNHYFCFIVISWYLY